MELFLNVNVNFNYVMPHLHYLLYVINFKLTLLNPHSMDTQVYFLIIIIYTWFLLLLRLHILFLNMVICS
jgi:hypothetical protein